jgi:aspartate/methionine/tyrosine aminotransferase
MHDSPSNPTGSNFSRSHLIRVASLAAKLRVLVIADEVYAGMAWSVTGPAPAARVKIPGKFNRGLFIPYASVAGDSPVLVVGALSKRWLAPGNHRSSIMEWVLPIDTNSELLARMEDWMAHCTRSQESSLGCERWTWPLRVQNSRYLPLLLLLRL